MKVIFSAKRDEEQLLYDTNGFHAFVLFYFVVLRPVYTTANLGYGTDKNSTGTKK